jgi:surfactin synthase thioesterase subunit
VGSDAARIDGRRFTTCTWRFDRLVPMLGDAEVVALDLPGHGTKADKPGVSSIAAMADAISPAIPVRR